MMGFLDKIFNKYTFDPFDFSVLKTDVHSHLIPGIDDGSKSLEESLNMLSAFSEMGYQKIITTPHIMSDYYKNTSDIILKGRDDVLAAISKQNLPIHFEAAAEYYLDEYFVELVNKKDLLSFSNQYVLFELPFIAEPFNLNETIFELQTKGYTPVLAHPERYGYWHQNKEMYHELNEKGVVLQLNLLSLTGHYSPEVKKVGEYLVENHLIKLVGSDCHRIEHLQILKDKSTSKHFQLLKELRLINQII
jgi:tyrosine-protein phosphatase YwqE